MIIQEAIKKAIEGGWRAGTWKNYDCEVKSCCLDCIDRETGAVIERSQFEVIFLDSSFWQSLGNALGWKNREYDMSTVGRGAAHVQQFKWKSKWHRFIDHLADGKSAESFFVTLR
jgi:hypothetical protein